MGGEKETVRMAKGIVLNANIDVCEERERLDVAVLVESIVHYVDVVLTDGL